MFDNWITHLDEFEGPYSSGLPWNDYLYTLLPRYCVKTSIINIVILLMIYHPYFIIWGNFPKNYIFLGATNKFDWFSPKEY